MFVITELWITKFNVFNNVNSKRAFLSQYFGFYFENNCLNSRVFVKTIIWWMLEITASIPKRLSNNRHVVQKRKYHTNAKKALESTKQESQESFHYKSRVKGGERESSKDKLRSCKIAEYARPLSLSFSLFLSLFFFFYLFLPFSLSFSLFLCLSHSFSHFLSISPNFSLFLPISLSFSFHPLSPSLFLFLPLSPSFSFKFLFFCFTFVRFLNLQGFAISTPQRIPTLYF